MKESTIEQFEQTVEQMALVYQTTVREFKLALYEMQSFDKAIMMCLIAEEMGIPLWEVLEEGKEPMNYHYEQARKKVRKLWSQMTVH